tara:strand:- start:103 stop:1068 length:966 start_codon:yes stop_codon:yes gene_type:complete
MGGVYKNVKKIVAIGDLHGDILQLITILIHSKLIKKKLSSKCVSNNDYDIKNWEWTGGSTYLVQLGDIFDGGGRSYEDTFDDNEVEIYKFLKNLKKMAREKNGDVILIIGNHEIMNFNKNYNYVQDKTLNKCLKVDDNGFSYKLNSKKPCSTTHRDKLFSIPDGPLAKSMSNKMKGVVKINDNVFCHGGISEAISKKYSIDEINNVLQLFLTGKKKYDDPLFQSIYGSNGIIWFREYSKDNSACDQLKNTLENLKATRMIVGHTPQKEGITNRCQQFKKNLWAIDVGLSRAFNTKINCQYLVITNNKPKIETCTLLSECHV